jgi:hypothetical protein
MKRFGDRQGREKTVRRESPHMLKDVVDIVCLEFMMLDPVTKKTNCTEQLLNHKLYISPRSLRNFTGLERT